MNEVQLRYSDKRAAAVEYLRQRRLYILDNPVKRQQVKLPILTQYFVRRILRGHY